MSFESNIDPALMADVQMGEVHTPGGPASGQTPELELETRVEESEEFKQSRIRVWELFKEEHAEVIDQVPLHLIRQYSLIKHLDEHADAHLEQLLPTLQSYFALRFAIEERSKPIPAHLEATFVNAEAGPSTLSASIELDDIKMEDERAPVPTPFTSLQRRSTFPPTSPALVSTPGPLRKFGGLGYGLQRTASTVSIPAERARVPQSTREFLSHIAWLAEEVLQASQEKRNVAQSAHDYVQRHIDELDAKILEEQTALAIGTRPGTHPAPFLAPEITPPAASTRSRKPISVAKEPEPQPEFPPEFEGATTIGTLVAASPPSTPAALAPRSHKRGAMKKAASSEPTKRRRKAPGGGRRTKAKPAAQQQVAVYFNELGEPMDPTPYCYCQQPSSGPMVGCDRDGCVLEWYHMECVGLTKLPEENEQWVCPSCRGDRAYWQRKIRALAKVKAVLS